MSAKERQRLVVLERVVRAEMTLSEASRSLGISYRQAHRLLGRYRSEGDAGLVHRARGRPSCRKLPAGFKEQVLALYQAHYPDFGPTLASETLAQRNGLTVNPETLRLWLIEAGLWQPRKQRQKHRSWRPRKACFGEMLQLDGSVHAWFEERGPRCFLMDLVDDATGTTELLFSAEETTEAALLLLEQWIRKHGVPAAVYVDRKKVYVTDRQPTIEEQLNGHKPLTQFGRACQQLGIQVVIASSPQAKGRVERKHGVCQDRLIKALRLEGISGIEGANGFLPSWLPGFNHKFRKEPRSATDLHRSAPDDRVLQSVFCRHEERSIQNDWTVRFQNRWFQILSEQESPNLRPKCGARVTVEAWRDGTLHFVHRGQELAVRELPARPERSHRPHRRQRPEHAAEAQPRAAPSIASAPSPDHPWRHRKRSYPEPWRLRELIEELASCYLAPTGFAELDALLLQQNAPSIVQAIGHF